MQRYGFKRWLLPTLVLIVGASQAQANVASGQFALLPDGGSTSWQLQINQTPAGDYTGQFFTFQQGVITGITYNTDEGSDLFVVTPGATFTNTNVDAGAFPYLMGSSKYSLGMRTQAVQVGTDFWLGARTRSYMDPGYNWLQPDPRFFDSFGWAHIQVDDQGGLHLLDSAMAFREAGIIVGSLQPVPEPSSLIIALVGLTLVGLSRLHARHPD